MRYAILSDVHANASALRAALADAADAGAEKIVCLGDVLGYGPEPVAALELVYRKAHVCLAGNHDDAVSGRFPVEDFTSFAADAVARQRALLAPQALDWLRHLPHVCAFPGPSGGAADGFACAHGDFSDPAAFRYVLEPADAPESWRARAETLLFVGHTHCPGVFAADADGAPRALPPEDFARAPGRRYLVNVGSVGYPRSGACRTVYCIYDDAARTVAFRSLPFDLEGYRAKMNGQGLDEAPWMRARAEARARPEVRGVERFGKDGGARPRVRAAKARVRAPERVRAASVGDGGRAEQARARRSLARAFVAGAALLAGAAVWCVAAIVRTVPPKVVELAEVRVEAPAAPEAEPPASDAPPTALGPVVAGRRCTVPAGGRLRFAVRLRKGGDPVWVRVRFEDGNGAPAGDGLWYPRVRLSKRSPKGGLAAPPGATAAFVEVVKAHAEDACEVVELKLEPFREQAK